jgi:hypothetical protein
MQQHTTSFFITMGAYSSSKVQNKFFKMMDPIFFLANYAIYCEKKKLLQIFFSQKKFTQNILRIHQNSPQLLTT